MKQSSRFRLLFSAALAATTFQPAFSQDHRDALRLSFLQPQGTARSIGIGNALGSVGGDFTSLSVNPAGIGVYRRSEIMISPSIQFNNTSTIFAGNSAEESGSHFSISNAGAISTRTEGGRRKQRSGWTALSFGIGLNRLADFTGDYRYQGRNSTSSGSFVFENDANEFGLSSSGSITSLADLGYQSYLLDTFGAGFISVVNPTADAPVSQSTLVRERGGIGEFVVSGGGNYQEKLMVGATLGFPVVRYIRTKTFDESDLSGDNNNDFAYFRYTNDLKMNGGGINFKLGFIYKPVDNFRIGAAFHTPTWFGISEFSNQAVTANTENFGGVQTAVALENRYDYNLSTPWRGIVSATAMLGTHGFFTVDYEYVNYRSAHFRFGESPEEQDYERYINELIKSTYRGASNVRTGLEIRLDNIMLRGGFGYYGNPYKSGSPDAQRLTFSGGLGFRFERAFIDLAYLHQSYKESEQPYSLPDQVPYRGIVVPTAQLKTGANNIVMTLGFKI